MTDPAELAKPTEPVVGDRRQAVDARRPAAPHLDPDGRQRLRPRPRSRHGAGDGPDAVPARSLSQRPAAPIRQPPVDGRIVAGNVLVLAGAVIGGVGWILAIVGLVPLLAGAFDVCVFAPLFRMPFSGGEIRGGAAR